MRDPVLTQEERSFLADARRAVLATISPDGRPRLVPICFALHPKRPALYTPIDAKPKQIDDPKELARVRDILADSRVTVLVDRWDEGWSRLAWLRCKGQATLLEPETTEHARAVRGLRARYPQYATHRLEDRPIIRVTIERTTSWGALAIP